MRTMTYLLTRLPGLALISVLLTAVPAVTAASATARQAWLYNRGSFKAVGGSSWIEKNPTGEFHFRETVRTGQYLELYDASRQMTVRLDASSMYWKTAGQKNWNYLYHGRWADTDKRPLDEDRLRGERTRLDNPTERGEFPHLGKDFEVLGPATKQYNCIAWSIGVTDQWVWPGEKV